MVALIAPVIKYLIDLRIVHKLLNKDVHFQGFKLWRAQESVPILRTIIVGEKLFCQIVIAGADLAAVFRVEVVELFIKSY